MIYSHTQVGRLLIALVAPMLVLMVVGFYLSGALAAAVVALLVLGSVLVMFGSLTVEVSEAEIRLRFGPGPIRKRFAVADIISASAVRTHWYNGWGIRWIPRGWLYNVSGFDAVEMITADNKRYLIGTDEPRELLSAIERARSRVRERAR